MDENLLKEVEALEEICGKMQLEVPDHKKGNKQSTRKVIVRYLNSEDVEDSEDGRVAILNQLDLEVGKKLKSKKTKEVKQELAGGSNDEKLNSVRDSPKKAASVEIKYTKFREFKIAGQVGNDGGEGLDYWSLTHQIREGKLAGYKYVEIRSGIIKAIKSGCSLRRYFESRPDIPEEKLLQILQSHFDIKDSTSMFTELANASQEPTETEMNFVLRAMDLRNKIVTLSEDEGIPFNEQLVRKKFFHALLVGLKKDTIRLELQNILKEATIEDEDLLKEVSQVVSRDAEHRKKLKGKNVVANMLDGGGIEKDEMNGAGKSVMTEISKLTTLVSQLAVKQDDMHKQQQQQQQQLASFASQQQLPATSHQNMYQPTDRAWENPSVQSGTRGGYGGGHGGRGRGGGYGARRGGGYSAGGYRPFV